MRLYIISYIMCLLYSSKKCFFFRNQFIMNIFRGCSIGKKLQFDFPLSSLLAAMHIADLAVSIDDHIARFQRWSCRRREQVAELSNNFNNISKVNSPLARAKRPSTKASERNFIFDFFLVSFENLSWYWECTESWTDATRSIARRFYTKLIECSENSSLL